MPCPSSLCRPLPRAAEEAGAGGGGAALRPAGCSLLVLSPFSSPASGFLHVPQVLGPGFKKQKAFCTRFFLFVVWACEILFKVFFFF